MLQLTALLQSMHCTSVLFQAATPTTQMDSVSQTSFTLCFSAWVPFWKQRKSPLCPKRGPCLKLCSQNMFEAATANLALCLSPCLCIFVSWFFSFFKPMGKTGAVLKIWPHHLWILPHHELAVLFVFLGKPFDISIYGQVVISLDVVFCPSITGYSPDDMDSKSTYETSPHIKRCKIENGAVSKQAWVFFFSLLSVK